ncbi:type I restriction-modification system subunit M [Lacticaseibacillus paracasei]|uniref:type I restriction-modification system subunit M n=1 Tax=Lacticaseibacillus paracasei TaxID=1597 RepID=UPI0009A2C1C9|nr:type I restriction-modification system subunit M [Lacticaseibacillus paracasei]OPH06483.1 type I restriction-modification system subunit M [Lacticaseibacillus paracasei]
MAEKNDAQQITSQLWAMANELRGNMDASEFRNYILGFMFYRYLSDNQENYLRETGLFAPKDGQTWNDAFRDVASDPESRKEYLEDISSELGYAIAPEQTWATLVQKVNDDKIIPSDYQELFDDFNKNASLNPGAESDFRGIFADINLGDSRLGNSTTARAKALSGIVRLVDSFDYNDKHGRDILGDVYEYLIAQFAGNSGKKAGEFYTPHQVSKVLAKLVTLDVPSDKEIFTVYDPTMGSGSLLLTVREELPKTVKGVMFHGQELNTTTFNLARMNLMMHNVPYTNMNLRNADTLEDDWPDGVVGGVDSPRSFDAVVANPPYSIHWDNNANKLKDPRFKPFGALAPKSKADFAFVEHGLYHLNGTGTMAIVLPHGVLFRGAAEGKIRKAIIEKNYLDAVIGMPAGLFFSTGIPTVVLVFKKNRSRRDIFFIDASNNFEKGKNQNILRDSDIDKMVEAYKNREDVDKYAHKAEPDEIKENEFNLNIPRYVDTTEPEKPVDVVKVVADIKESDKKIAQLSRELAKDIDDLVANNDEAAKQLAALKELFKNE